MKGSLLLAGMIAANAGNSAFLDWLCEERSILGSVWTRMSGPRLVVNNNANLEVGDRQDGVNGNENGH
jgi:hypothetical protein